MAFVHGVVDIEDPARTPRGMKILKPWQTSFARKVGTPERQRARQWSELAVGVAGEPRHRDLVRQVATQELNRTVATLAEQLNV